MFDSRKVKKEKLKIYEAIINLKLLYNNLVTLIV